MSEKYIEPALYNKYESQKSLFYIRIAEVSSRGKDAIAEYRGNRWKTRRSWLTVSIAALALIVSVVALVISIVC